MEVPTLLLLAAYRRWSLKQLMCEAERRHYLSKNRATKTCSSLVGPILLQFLVLLFKLKEGSLNAFSFVWSLCASGWLPGTRRCSMPRFHRLFWHNAADLDFCLQSRGFVFPFKLGDTLRIAAKTF